MTSRLLSALFVAAIAAGLQYSAAETTNLIAIADTGLWHGAPNNNLGHETFMPVGTSMVGGHVGRGLIKFDLSAIPDTATINSATLTLTIVLDRSGLEMSVHRMLRSWIEGVGIGGPTTGQPGSIGSPAQTGEPTWNLRAQPSTSWGAAGSLAGVDFVSAASASGTPVGATLTFSSAGLTADVQRFFANAGTNFGWLIKNTGEGSGGARRVATREDSANAPVLIVDYSLPAPPMSPTIFDVALNENQIRFSFNAEADRTYTIEARDSLSATSWSTVTNIPAQPVNSTIDFTNAISSDERYFRIKTP